MKLKPMDATQIRDYLLLSCAIVGAIVAVIGLSTWRRQLKGNAHFDAARALVRCVYSFHETYLHLRSRFMYASDLPVDDETGHKSNRVDLIYGERLRFLSKEMARLESALLEAKVLWGNEIEDSIREYREIMRLIRYDFMEFCQASEPGQTQFNHQEVRDMRKKFLGSPDGSDEMYKKVEAAKDRVVGKMEKYLRK